MKKILFLFLFVLFGILTLCIKGCNTPKEKHSFQLPSYPIKSGVSAPFAGFIGDWILVGGGCNFPTIPAADGGTKVYYKDLYACKTTKDSLMWELYTNFYNPIAYGASVETKEGIICIGGMNQDSSFCNVFRISVDSLKNQLSIDDLPSLPESIDNGAATHINQRLFITGGNQTNGGNSLYTLSLEKDSAWVKLADYPGPQRIQPVLLASDDFLFLFGGFQINASTKEAIISSDFITYNLKDNKWSKPQNIPSMNNGGKRALVGCTGIRIDNLLLIAGGVNYEIFKAAVEGRAPKDYMKQSSEWYQFNKDLLIYDLQNKSWTIIPDVEGFNKAGGSLLHHNGSLYMVCGEIKPGIRTNQIVKKELQELLSRRETKQ